MLKGAPQSPGYSRSVIPSQVSRLAISDIAYSDFAGQGLFYLAQTDWSAGIKSESIWRDDAKYFYSTNIDTYSSQGEIKTEMAVTSKKVFSTDAYCGNSVTVAGATNSYIGVYKDTNIGIWKDTAGVWGEIAGVTFATSQNAPAYIIGHKDIMWVGTVGAGNSDVVESFNGTSWADQSAAIITATAWTGSSIKASRSACEVGGILYVGVEDYLNGESGIVSTDDAGSTWSLVTSFGYDSQIISMCDYNSKLYYLQYSSPKTFLRVYDPVTSVDSLVWTFNTGTLTLANTSVSDRLLKIFLGKLIITLPNKIYEYDGAINEIFKIDSKKTAIGYEADSNLKYGCVQKGNRLYWGNLIYDGTYFFNYKKPASDVTNLYLYPFFVDSSDALFYLNDISNDVTLYSESSSYKATTAKNFIVFNEMAPVVSIDKLLYSVTAIFEKMVAGDEIKIEYSINNRATWTSAGTLTYTTEGGTNVKREIIIPGSILFSKIWWKVSMANTNGTSSPILLDLIMAYKPMPDYKNRWNLRLNFTDGIKLLNKQNDDREGDDLTSQLWNEKLTKKQVNFKDIDYQECTLLTGMTATQTSASISATKQLPNQGRIRAVSGSVSEEMYYTSAKTNAIYGITRGARGTKARAYLSGQVLDNGYSVYVEDIETNTAFTDENKTESVAQVLLIES